MEIPIASTQAPGRARVAVGLLLALVLALAAVRLDNALVFFVPAALLAVPVLGLRILTRPVSVVAVFLLLSVNLDILTVGKTGISLHIVFSALLMWAMAVRLSLTRHRPFRTPVERAFLLFLAVTFVSVVLSVSPVRSLKNWLRDVEYLVLYSFLIDLVLRADDRKTMAGAVILSSLIPCLAGLVGVLFDIPEFYGLDTPIAGGEIIRRVYGTLRHPVSLSIYLATTATMTLSLLLDGRWFRRTYLFALLLLQCLVLYLTYGRTGWVVMFVSTAILLAISGRRRWLLMGLPALLGGMVLLVPRFLARWQTAWSPEGDSFLWRVGLWAYTLTLIPRRPFFGSGPDTFTEYVAYGSGRASHQTWIGLGLETGLVGVAAFLVFVITILVMLRRRMRQDAWRRDPIAQAAVAGFWGVLAGSLAENPFEVPVIATLAWVLLALVLNERGGPERPAES
jgi:O-antigen ligase